MKKSNSSAADPAYQVGYGKPPKANQFPKGRTGNPKGKRRGEENIISAFKRHVLKRVKTSDGDQVSTMTLAEAVILKNYHAALQKNPFAMSNIYRLADDAGEFVNFADAKQVGRPIVVPERVKTTEEFMAQFGRNRETK
jgi:Family of unknown function (DUF5681)